MEDIISRGEGTPPRWSRRRRLAVAAALVAVTALVVAEHLPHGRTAGHQRGAGRHSTAAGQPRGGGPGVREVEIPSGIAGATGKLPARARLPRTGARPTWYVPAKGATEPIGGLPAVAAGYTFTKLDSGWAIQPEASTQSSCAGCPGVPLPAYYLADQAQAATRIGAATMVAPGTGGRLWLTSFPAGNSLGTRAGTARQYSSAGVPEGPAVTLPEGFAIARGTTAGVLLISITERDPAGFYWLWNPATGKTIRGFWGVIATSATEVAVVRNCVSTCVVNVVNVASGKRTSLKLQGGGRVNAASFSSDGRYLAFAVIFSDGLVNGAATVLEVASLKTGHLTVVPHTGVSSDALGGFGWPGDDDRLVAELVFSTRTQMAFWKPGTRAPAVTVLRPDQDPADLVVG
ncbi:MAG TPA: hypothetical protein VFI65_16335 [Streptosporangiaceae bacterium]|nr:hypothetical protein [Streptosporangiaceae bacterium]